MKRITCITIALLFTALAMAQPQLYEVKSGHIEYQLSGNTEGTKTFWWDDFGAKQYTLEKSTTTVKVFGIKDVQEHHMLTIHNGGYVYTLDYITNEAGKVNVQDQMDLGEFVQNSYTQQQQEDMRDETLASLGGQMSGTDVVLGRTCEIMELPGGKSWLHKQISLKSETKVMGITRIETAISMEENINIPASKFEPPADVEFTDYSSQTPWGGMEYEEDEDESDAIPVEITKDQFCNALNNAASSSLIINACMEYDGVYNASGTYNGVMVGISPVHSDNVKQAQAAGEIPDNAEVFSINGHKAIYADKIYDEDEGEYVEMPMLMVEYKQKNLYIMIAAVGELSKADLSAIAKKINF